MAAYFELVPCVPVGPQAGASGELQRSGWTSPQDLRAMTMLSLGRAQW